MQHGKNFKLSDTILTVICVVFNVEAAAPVASIGNSQYFWWILMITAFLLPFGLISSELGTAYNGNGGMYDWVRAAYPEGKTAGRTAWCYWINFPLWMASLAVLCPNLISSIVGIRIGFISSLIIQLALIWTVVLISTYPVCDSTWILRGCTAAKMLLAAVMGILGIYGAITYGVANQYTAESFLPSFDLSSLSYISVIIFNCLGFEVICTLTNNMENPRKQIPKSIITGGIAVAAINIFCAFGIGVAIPYNRISTATGLLDAMKLLSGKSEGAFLSAMALLFLISLLGNMISWSLGVNNMASYAADNHDLPQIFARRRTKNNMPVGSAVMNGMVASAVVLIGSSFPYSNLFWSFFALNLVMTLLSYLPVFPAFLKLRRKDPNRDRPFKVPGGSAVQTVLAIVPMSLIIVSLIFTTIPMSFDQATLLSKLPITIGSAVFLILGEIVVSKCKKGLSHTTISLISNWRI